MFVNASKISENPNSDQPEDYAKAKGRENPSFIHTVCPRSLALFYIVTYNMNGARLLKHTYTAIPTVQ